MSFPLSGGPFGPKPTSIKPSTRNTTIGFAVHRRHKRTIHRLTTNASASPAEDNKEFDFTLNYQALEETRKRLEKAIKEEDYSVAAKLKTQLDKLEKINPELQLQKQLQAAINEERYEDAAAIRDQLREIEAKKPPPPPMKVVEVEEIPCSPSSSKTTNGIKVECQSFFVPQQSSPAKNYYFFAYKIKITNVSSKIPVKLKSRYWRILDANRQLKEVTGPGVVGEEPELEMGESFEYTSACPLPTSKGSMEGEYEFYTKRTAAEQNWTKSLLVEIPKFQLNADIKGIGGDSLGF